MKLMMEPEITIPEDKPQCIVWDLDGTLNDNYGQSYHRGELIADFEYNYPVWQFYQELRKRIKDIRFVIFSSASETNRSKIEAWLKDWNYDYDELLLREIGDEGHGLDVKRSLLQKVEKDNSILAIIDDRKDFTDEWRRRGYLCLAVADNRF